MKTGCSIEMRIFLISDCFGDVFRCFEVAVNSVEFVDL